MRVSEALPASSSRCSRNCRSQPEAVGADEGGKRRGLPLPSPSMPSMNTSPRCGRPHRFPLWCRVAHPWARRHSRPAHRDDPLGVVPRHPRRSAPRPSDPASAVRTLGSDASLWRHKRPPSCRASSVIVGLVRHPPCLPLLPTPRQDRLVYRSWKVGLGCLRTCAITVSRLLFHMPTVSRVFVSTAPV